MKLLQSSPFFVMSKFREVFHTDLPSMSLNREIDFCINSESGTHPISIPPCRMSPAELRELKFQIQELLNKEFIRSSSFPRGGLVFLFRRRMVV